MATARLGCLLPICASPTPPQPLPTLFEANARLKQLIQCGHLNDATHLFDQMPHRDAISYTTLISGYLRASQPHAALALFSSLRSHPTISSPDPFVLSLALKASASQPSLNSLCLPLHSLSLKLGLLSASPFVSTALLDAYSKTHYSPLPAIKVFHEMPHRNVVTWTALLTTLVRAGRPEAALRGFSEMRDSGIACDSHTFAIAFKACADAGLVSRGREVHAIAAKLGLDAPSFAANSLATMYAKCGELPTALALFSGMPHRDVVSWTAIISALLQVGRHRDSLEAFLQMLSDSSPDAAPNEYTYAAAISACAGLASAAWGDQIHAHAAQRGLARASSVANALVTLYSRTGRVVEADTVFRETTFKDLISYSAVISAHAQVGQVEEAFVLFAEMRAIGTRPNEFPLASLLSACACGAMLSPGRQAHAHVLAAGLDGEAMVSSALITMYSRCGSVEEAERVFDGLHRDNVISWTAMIDGYAEHGISSAAIELFNRMPEAGLSPDYVTFIGVLIACSHAGLMDLGIHHFESMRKVYGIEPGREHYGCMVDLLGRAGRLAEAERVIEMMPGRPDDVVWSALLRACTAHGDAERGRRAAERILEVRPGCGGTHIALSNIYALTGRYRDAAETRKRMRAKGVKKDAGSSWIEAGEGVSVFVAGDRMHPREKEIYGMLEFVDSDAKFVDSDAKFVGFVPEMDSLELDAEEELNYELFR